MERKMSIAQNYPNLKPSLLLDFSNTEELDPRITFTRASTATYYGTQTAKAEENLLLQSQDFTTSWANSNSTDAADTSVAPDGTTTADTLTDNDTAGVHIVSQAPVLIVGAIYTMSCFLKASTNDFALVTLTNGTTVENGIAAVIDLSAGTISETDTGTSATLTSSSITSVGSGWYRVVITGSSLAGFNRAEVGLAPAGTGNTFSNTQRISYTGTGTSIFVWGAQLEQRSAVTAYTPTTTQTITNYIPVLQTAASGVARFDHNPTTFESLGLLIEEQRTNLVTYSEVFSDAAWNKTRSSITANTIVAPDGTLTGDKLVEDTTASNTHYLRVDPVYVANTSYTFSVYLKASERTQCQIALNLFNSGNLFATLRPAIDVDLASGTITSSTSGVTSSSITAVGNGWYRCSVSGLMGSTGGAQATGIFLLNSSVSNTYTGDGYSGIYIWGAQLEAGAFPTSYIPTVASQVTRSSDSASMTGANFSSWYNQAAGTVYSESTVAQIGVLSITAALSDGTTNNRVQIQRTASNNFQDFVVSGSATQSSVSVSGVTANVSVKVASAYQVNSFQMAANATLGTEDTSGTVPVVDRLELGSRASSSFLNGHIRKVSYYPLRVTNAQLQALTS